MVQREWVLTDAVDAPISRLPGGLDPPGLAEAHRLQEEQHEPLESRGVDSQRPVQDVAHDGSTGVLRCRLGRVALPCAPHLSPCSCS
jgi:hypothetical protein